MYCLICVCELNLKGHSDRFVFLLSYIVIFHFPLSYLAAFSEPDVFHVSCTETQSTVSVNFTKSFFFCLVYCKRHNCPLTDCLHMFIETNIVWLANEATLNLACG